MPTREDAQAVARRLHALSSEPQICRKAAARDLAQRHPVDANELIDQLLGLRREGWEAATCALGAYAAALSLEADSIPHAEDLRRLANIQSLWTVEALFAEGPPVKELDPNAAARADAKLFSQSLGHLKTMARATRDPDELAKLAIFSNPVVVRNALMNPRLTEEGVIRIAARRPARPEPLLEIWRSPRWSSRHSVRRALVFNPYFPPDIAAKIVPLLNRTDWEELAGDSGVHPTLRHQARLLLGREPAVEG
jgi:hypothetical protein